MNLAPVVLPETKPYWAAAAAGRLEIQRCVACATCYFPPAPICPHCTSRHVAWEQMSGRATLYSYVITASPWPQWNHSGPMSVATIALEEGPRLISTIVDCEQTPAALRIDMPLVATWRAFGDGPKLLCFAPVMGAGQ